MINVNHIGHVLFKAVIAADLMVHIYLGKSVQGGEQNRQPVCFFVFCLVAPV